MGSDNSRKHNNNYHFSPVSLAIIAFLLLTNFLPRRVPSNGEEARNIFKSRGYIRGEGGQNSVPVSHDLPAINPISGRSAPSLLPADITSPLPPLTNPPCVIVSPDKDEVEPPNSKSTALEGQLDLVNILDLDNPTFMGVTAKEFGSIEQKVISQIKSR